MQGGGDSHGTSWVTSASTRVVDSTCKGVDWPLPSSYQTETCLAEVLMKKWIVLVILAASSLGFTACRRPERERQDVGGGFKLPELQEVDWAEGGCRFKLPQPVKDQSQPAGDFTMHFRSYETKDGAMGVAYGDLPISSAEPGDVIERRLDGGRDGMLRSSNAKLIREKKINLGRYPGREVTGEMQNPSGELRARYAIIRTRFYLLMVAGRSNFVQSKEAAAFLASFELTVDPMTFPQRGAAPGPGGPVAQGPGTPVGQPPAGPIVQPPNPGQGPMPSPKQSTPAKRTPINGVTAYWNFDRHENGLVQDFSGRNNHGRIYQAQGVQGVKGFALAFGGNPNQYFDMGSSQDFDYLDGWDFTYAGWFRTQAPRGTILSQRNPPQQRGGAIFIRIHADGLLCTDVVNGLGSASSMRSKQKVNNGLWHHFALMRAGNTMRLFLDGQQVAEESAPQGSGAITTKYRYIGSDKGAAEGGEKGDQLGFVGYIDEICIFQKALSAQEILAMVRNP
jgi:sialidase-1